MYTLYILKCSDNTLYTGITNNIEKRLKMHNRELPGGAKYTRTRLPVSLVYQEEVWSRSEATKRELQVKKLTHQQKLTLINKSHT